ncbi:MAG: trypsin-like peptidase domain-containing protein [Phaeodactylibacter sp.]|nr:trypsin-like peptidase domain-containing protein [Phaeodactylibacter sp.]
MEITSLVRSIVKVTCGGKTGSGFLLKGGYIVTAYHVVDGGNPARFFVCDDHSCFEQEVTVLEQPAFKLTKEEGDLAVYKIEEEEKYEGRYLSLALDKAMLCGRAFSTFGFPEGNRINGNPYHSARLEDNNSANDYGVKKLTLSDPGNVSKGYSGGPVYITGYGVVGVITQKWEEIAIGLPSSVIAEKIPELKPEERFFPVESIDKYRCLVVHHGEESQAKVFFDQEVELALEIMELSDKLFLKRYHLGAEMVSLKQAVAEASCACLWFDNAADILAFKAEGWLRYHPIFLFNYGLDDKVKLKYLLEFFKPAPCFPAKYGLLPGFHYFKAIENAYGSSSEAYKGWFEFLNSEFVSYDDKLRALLMEFDFTAGREAMKRACRSGKRFLFHCLEGTRDCGVEVLAHHGVNIVRDRGREAKDVNIQVLDWENHAPATPEEFLAALHLSTDNWFASDAQRIFILQNFIHPGMSESMVDARVMLINQLITKCSNRTAPENWNGALHFFLLNTDKNSSPLHSKLNQPGNSGNWYITEAQVISLSDDPEPVDKFPDDLTKEAVPGIIRQKLEGQLPKKEDCPYVGAFLREVCSLLDAPHIYHQELTRL